MKEISKVQVIEPLGTGDIVIENVLGLGVDVVITSDLMKGELSERVAVQNDERKI